MADRSLTHLSTIGIKNQRHTMAQN